jgi:Fe-S-cluster containining protein
MAEMVDQEDTGPERPDAVSFGDDVDTVPQCTGRCCDPVTLHAEMYWDMSRNPGSYRNARYILSMLTYDGAVPRHGEIEFRCKYFDGESRRCVAYDRRPDMCREYPESGVCGYCGGRFTTGSHPEPSGEPTTTHEQAARLGAVRTLIGAGRAGAPQRSAPGNTQRKRRR